MTSGILLLIPLIATETFPFEMVNNAYSRFKASQANSSNEEDISMYILTIDPNLEVEIRADKHFWYPQIVLWKEDTLGTYLETLFITRSTAKGEFLGGRTKDNFKSFDSKRSDDYSDLRRVDALPFWSHSRGIKYQDGLYAPPPDSPMPDGITGATPEGSFKIRTTTDPDIYKLLLEVNVAFDDNKYYSVYDYPDDSLYHSGTGLLGQPSVVYEATINPALSEYHLMTYKGHTHPSGANGELASDKIGLTTALEIIDLALVKASTPPLSTVPQ